MPIRDVKIWTCECCGADHTQEFGAPAPGWSRITVESVDPTEGASAVPVDRPSEVRPTPAPRLCCHDCSARVEAVLYPAQTTQAVARSGVEALSGNRVG